MWNYEMWKLYAIIVRIQGDHVAYSFVAHRDSLVHWYLIGN